MADEGYHEPFEVLPESIRDMHRAIVTLMEELEAVDWYYQRAAASKDEALREVLIHHANEETEHAMMVLEWIRRRDPKFDEMMRKYLFKQGSIVGVEEAATGKAGAGTAAAAAASSLDVGPAASTPTEAFPLHRGAQPTLGSLRDNRRPR